MSENKDKLVTFLDPVQRTIIAEAVSNDDNKIVVKNPVVVNIVPQIDQITRQPNGAMALQLIPLYFKEFMGDKNEPIEFTYNKNQITEISFKGGFNFRLYAQYESIFNPTGIVVPQGAGEVQPVAQKPGAPVLKLFED